MEATTTLVAGALVRLIALGIGAFLCWLGYRLFLEVPVAEAGDAELSGLRGATIKLTRIAPGVFFALFGTATVIWALSQKIEYQGRIEGPDGHVVAQTAGAVNASLGVGGAGAASGAAGSAVAPPAGNAAVTRGKLHQEIAWLNQVSRVDDRALRQQVIDDAAFLVPRIKLRLMLAGWDADAWGDAADFVDWYDRTKGAGEPPPGLTEAATFFREGSARSGQEGVQ